MGWPKRPYGAYLLLQALLAKGGSPARVLLVSPVLGASLGVGRVVSVPPGVRRMWQALEGGRFPSLDLEIYTGADDAPGDPTLARRFAELVPGIRLTVVPGAGHDLPADCLTKRWADLLARLRPARDG